MEFTAQVNWPRHRDGGPVVVLPPGFFISCYFWDIESGGLAIDQRGHGRVREQFADIGIPRDGGLADLLAEGASPEPRFAAVICEDIERSGRDTYYAPALGRRRRHRHDPAAARLALGQHRSHPPGRSAR
jgi:hypothetical protein